MRVSAKPGYRLTTAPEQAISSTHNGVWGVVSDSSLEDVRSGRIVYKQLSCTFTASAALNVYVGDSFMVTARVTPPECGDTVTYTFDRGDVLSVSEVGAGVYQLIVSTDTVGIGMLKALHATTVVGSTTAKVIQGTWVSSATWKYAGVNAGWTAAKPSGSERGAQPKGGSQMIYLEGGMHEVPVGSFCTARLAFNKLSDGRSLPGAYNNPYYPSFGLGMIRDSASGSEVVFEYEATGVITVQDSSTIELPPNVQYYWGDLLENNTVFQIRSTESFQGVGVARLHVRDAASNDFPTNILGDVHYWPNALISLEAVSTSASFPPDKPGGTDGQLNPKWRMTGENLGLGLPYTAGTETLTITAPPPEDKKVFGVSVSCGDSTQAVRFRPVEVEGIVVTCSDGRGYTNYLEVVAPHIVAYSMNWNCDNAIGSPPSPLWEVSPPFPLLNGNPGEVVSQSLLTPITPNPVTYTANCWGKTATVVCYPLDKTEFQITDPPGDLENFINNKLSSIVDNIQFTAPRGSASFAIYNKEQANTLEVGRPWSLDVGFTPFIGVEWSDHLLSTHPLMLALNAIGLEAGPFISLSGSVSATVTGLGRDEYDKPLPVGANSVSGSIVLGIGAEVRSEDEGKFRLFLDATSEISLTGAFTVDPELCSVYLDNCLLDIGGLNVNAGCEVNLEVLGWTTEVDISKTWTILQPSSSEAGRINLL